VKYEIGQQYNTIIIHVCLDIVEVKLSLVELNEKRGREAIL
jgi:hypothetical protein